MWHSRASLPLESLDFIMEIDHQEIIDQRLALAKYIASNGSVYYGIDGRNAKAITKMIAESELFDIYPSVVVTDSARACANSIREALADEKMSPECIEGVEIEAFDISDIDENDPDLEGVELEGRFSFGVQIEERK